MLHLHIGRGKSGSSTIQAFASQNTALLARHGIDVPESVDPSGNHVSLVRAVMDPGADQSSLEEFRDILNASDGRNLFVSSEFFSTLPRIAVERFSEIVGQHKINILMYIRPYPSWISSRYAQDVKKGRFFDDFDEYYKLVAPEESVVPDISCWLDFFEKDVFRIRALIPEHLEGGQLLSDFSAALNLPLEVGDDFRHNTSLHWWTLEFLRAFDREALIAETSIAPSVRDRRRLMSIVEALARDAQEPAVSYLSRRQWRASGTKFLSDMKHVSLMLGSPYQEIELRQRSRSFLPSIRRMDRVNRKAISRKISKSHRNRPFSDHAAVILDSLGYLRE